jgi:hypothetical protein
MKPNRLKLVADNPPVEIHIGDKLRADIRKRDWPTITINGDRQAPVFLRDRAKGGWR